VEVLNNYFKNLTTWTTIKDWNFTVC